MALLLIGVPEEALAEFVEVWCWFWKIIIIIIILFSSSNYCRVLWSTAISEIILTFSRTAAHKVASMYNTTNNCEIFVIEHFLCSTVGTKIKHENYVHVLTLMWYRIICTKIFNYRISLKSCCGEI